MSDRFVEVRNDLPNGFEKDVVGYCDPLSVRPGATLGFKLSSYQPGPARLAIVQLICGDDGPHGLGLMEREVAADLPTEVELTTQPLICGSCATVPDMPGVERGEFELWVYPTLLREEAQIVANLAGIRLAVDSAGFAVDWPGGNLRVAAGLRERRWYRLRLNFGDEVVLEVERAAAGTAEQTRLWRAHTEGSFSLPPGPWYFAAAGAGTGHFNGRLEAPALKSRGRVIAAWDFGREIHSQTIVDVCGEHHGALFQTPTRGVAGVHWDGSAQSFRDAPSHYGAIHFHEDDLTDAGWADSASWVVPDELPSGQYALKVVQGSSDDYVPFFVRPAQGQRSADLLYLVPTASYLAYANQRLALDANQLLGFAGPIRNANDAFLLAHEEVGLSLYEHHHDGSGVHFSSRLRPVLNMKAKTGAWGFVADTRITAWLDAIDRPFDVLTDEDLHLEGAQALAGYRTVVTGTHPEYYSTAMRESVAAWLGQGGRLMYMGGNGFYWRVAYAPDNPAIVEVRRAEDGTRAWMSAPGEYYQQFNGEYGGLWRRLGKPPNELVGIGFAAQGLDDGSTCYRVQPGASDPRVDFIVDGVDATDTWGDFSAGGGIAEEIDRWDAALGSPAHAVILATCENRRSDLVRTKEEFHAFMGDTLGEDPEVKADMVFFEVPGGGAVFSTGSISYAGALAHNDYDNEIARITGNVLRRFLDPDPFEYPGSGNSRP